MEEVGQAQRKLGGRVEERKVDTLRRHEDLQVSQMAEGVCGTLQPRGLSLQEVQAKNRSPEKGEPKAAPPGPS